MTDAGATGYYANPERPFRRSLVHVVGPLGPICGTKIGPNSVFCMNAPFVYMKYVECIRCCDKMREDNQHDSRH